MNELTPKLLLLIANQLQLQNSALLSNKSVEINNLLEEQADCLNRIIDSFSTKQKNGTPPGKE